MAKRRAEMEDFVVEEVTEAETPQIVHAVTPIQGTKVINTEEYVKKADVKSISTNPFLTEEQKRVLFDYEMHKILADLVIPTDFAVNDDLNTLLKYTTVKVVEPITQYVLVRGRKDLLEKAWDFYKVNAKDPTIENFVSMLLDIVGHDAIKPLYLNILDLN